MEQQRQLSSSPFGVADYAITPSVVPPNGSPFASLTSLSAQFGDLGLSNSSSAHAFVPEVSNFAEVPFHGPMPGTIPHLLGASNSMPRGSRLTSRFGSSGYRVSADSESPCWIHKLNDNPESAHRATGSVGGKCRTAGSWHRSRWLPSSLLLMYYLGYSGQLPLHLAWVPSRIQPES